jgi:hypothetical protein
MSGQHYWEVGLKGFSVPDLIRRMERCFEVVDSYRNKDWLPSHNFILKSKAQRDLDAEHLPSDSSRVAADPLRET